MKKVKPFANDKIMYNYYFLSLFYSVDGEDSNSVSVIAKAVCVFVSGLPVVRLPVELVGIFLMRSDFCMNFNPVYYASFNAF